MNESYNATWPFDCPVDLGFDLDPNRPESEGIKQGTYAHFQERCGKICASDASFALKRQVKGNESETRRTYKMQIVAEIRSGNPLMDKYFSRDMERGQELEPQARTAYEMKTGQMVETVGFIHHPRLARCGCSPDGLVGSDGQIEIKCPRITNHLKWACDGIVPEKHIVQVIANLACTGRRWIDFVSYAEHEGLPDTYKLFVVRVERGKTIEGYVSSVDQMITEYEEAVEMFNGEVDDMLRHLDKLFAT